MHRGVTLYENVGADSGAPAEGIDVSGYQPIVNWASVTASGIAFAFVKATEATTLLDHTFVSHWAQAQQAKLLRGAYHFFRPRQDAVAQAKFFLAQLGDPGELPPVLDVEVADGVAPAQIAAGVSTWLNFVAANLGRVIVYTSPAFWNALPAIPDIASWPTCGSPLRAPALPWRRTAGRSGPSGSTPSHRLRHPRHRRHGREPLQRITHGASRVQCGIRCVAPGARIDVSGHSSRILVFERPDWPG
jgi:hypothetical protein